MRTTVTPAGFARWSPLPAALAIRGAMTAAAWVTWLNGSPITVARVGTGADEKWGLVVPSDGSVSWEQYDGSFRSATLLPAGTVQAGTPAHVAISRAADGVSLVGYLNGRRAAQTVIAGGMATATAPTNGTVGSANGSTVTAYAAISDFTVWSSVLTDAEVLAAFLGVPTPRNLVGRWPLAADYRDVGPNALHMIAGGGLGSVLDLAVLR